MATARMGSLVAYRDNAHHPFVLAHLGDDGVDHVKKREDWGPCETPQMRVGGGSEDVQGERRADAANVR